MTSLIGDGVLLCVSPAEVHSSSRILSIFYGLKEYVGRSSGTPKLEPALGLI